MDMSKEEVEEMLDGVFLASTGRTYRGDAHDLELAAKLAEAKKATPPSEGPKAEPDSLQKIKADFPSLFGKSEA